MCLTFRCFHISTYYIYLFLGKNCGIAVFCLNDFLRINCSVVTGEQRFIGVDVHLKCQCFKFSVALFVCSCVCSIVSFMFLSLYVSIYYFCPIVVLWWLVLVSRSLFYKVSYCWYCNFHCYWVMMVLAYLGVLYV